LNGWVCARQLATGRGKQRRVNESRRIFTLDFWLTLEFYFMIETNSGGKLFALGIQKDLRIYFDQFTRVHDVEV